MNFASIADFMSRTIPISLFNQGKANKIFDDVVKQGTKIVLKNNKPACVLVSPKEYAALAEIVENYMLAMEADARMSHYDPASTISQDEIMARYGLTDADLTDTDDIEIE